MLRKMRLENLTGIVVILKILIPEERLPNRHPDIICLQHLLQEPQQIHQLLVLPVVVVRQYRYPIERLQHVAVCGVVHQH